MLKMLLMLLLLTGALRAEEDSDFGPGDVLYAPEEMTGSAEAVASSGSYYSSARISVGDYASGMQGLKGAEIFVDGVFVGKSPLELSGVLISKPQSAVSARLDGYDEALRAAVRIPMEGELKIAMSGDRAASWYTLPSWVAGLAMFGGAIAAYAQNSSSSSATGMGLVIGGVGVIAISQGIARIFHLPSLRDEVERVNAKAEPGL